MNVNDIPKAWRSALASVQLTFPDAVIAGGALRDREQGVKVKDIDIFVSTTTPGIYDAGSIVSRLQHDGWADAVMNGDESYSGHNSGRGIVAVVDMKYPGTPSIQLIAMKQFRLEEIDFGICQIMFDGKTIVRTPDYHHDLAARQFRLIPKVDDAMFVRSLGRWARLKEKYPEWKLHLGSRAETDPFVPPKPKTMTTVRPSGPAIGMLKGVTEGIQPPLPRGSFKAYLDVSSSQDIAKMLAGPGDYVVPKALAERLAKETTAQLLKTDAVTQTCTVRVDDHAVMPSTKIIQEMIEAKRQLDRDMALRRAAHP